MEQDEKSTYPTRPARFLGISPEALYLSEAKLAKLTGEILEPYGVDPETYSVDPEIGYDYDAENARGRL